MTTNSNTRARRNRNILLTSIILDDFLRFLRAEAAATYIEVLTFQRILERMDLTLDQLNRLAEVNQVLLEGPAASYLRFLHLGIKDTGAGCKFRFL